MQRDWLMGWAPLAHIFADGLPARPALRSPDPLRFTDAEQAKRRVLDVPLNQAVAPTVAPSVRPVAEQASTREFRVGDRVRVRGSSPSVFCKPGMEGVIVAVTGLDLDIRFDSGEEWFAAREWVELIPAQREQVVSPSVRQPDSKGESKGTTASDGNKRRSLWDCIR